MAKPRPDKKRQKAKPVQSPLPGMPPPEPPGTARVLPMQLQIGDLMTDSTGEWEVVGRPYTTAGGKNSHVRVQRVDKPGVTETRLWGSHDLGRRALRERGPVSRFRARAAATKGHNYHLVPAGDQPQGGEALGLTIPQSLLVLADQVIE